MGRRRLGLAACGALAAAGAGALSVAQADGGFVEPVTVLHAFHQDQGPATFGWAVSELQDIDGDGVTDVIVGEPFRQPRFHGRLYVYSGATGAPLLSAHGKPGDTLGYSIADGGDENGDGVHDIVGGAAFGGGTGRVYVYSGASKRRMAVYTGPQAGARFGYAVAGAGDVNGDGYDDLLVGAPFYNGTAAQGAGRAFVYSGKTHELLYTLHGDAGTHGFGSGTDHAGDLDGDGVGDLLVGAFGSTPSTVGKAYAFSGRTGRELWEVRAPASTGGGFAQFFVAGLDDVNGDGTPDVYVSDYADNAAGPGAGAATVYSGVDGSVLYTIQGSGPGQGLGPGREAGDVNGDGVQDLAIGSYTSSDGATNAGKVQVFSGVDGSLLRTITSTTPNEQLGFDVVGIGDTNGDGIPDLLASAASGNSVYVIAGTRP
jgi:hypothetical protein